MKYLSENKRVITSFWYFPAAYGEVYRLQIKKRYWWKTVAWIYAEIMEGESEECIIDWLQWKERKQVQRRVKI